MYPGSPDIESIKFTGKERDAETGMDFFLARYYSSPQGGFTSPDEFKGGIVDPFTGKDIETNTALPYADITDPQTLNKYAYVRNNPLRYTDPDGHCAEALTCTVELGAAGAEVGSIFGPAGTVVGAIVGGGIGAFIGYEAGKAIVSFAQKNEKTETSPAASKEPAQLAAGKEAHNKEEVRPGEKAEVTTPSGKGRMDRYNESEGHIREIKPDNPRQVKAGQKQLEQYKTEMEKATNRPHSTELTLYPPKPVKPPDVP
jgi:RHS repeat-associated protein